MQFGELSIRLRYLLSDDVMAMQMYVMNKMFTYVMPVMIGMFTLTTPAGVGIYWGISTLYSVVQQKLILGTKK